MWAGCRLPEIAPGALDHLSPAELLDAGHYLRAARILQPIANERPEDGQIAWLLSRARAALGDLDDAMKLAETALASDDDNPAYHVQAAAVAGKLAEKASLLRRLNYARRARQELDAAIAIDQKNTAAQWGLMMYYFAAPSLIGGDKDKAQQVGEQLAADEPGLGRYYQGRLAAELKDQEKAELFYKQSALENPLSFDTAAALAGFYIEKRSDQTRAERWACQAVHADPTRGDAWALLARVYTMCGCWTEAMEIARRAEAIDPDDLSPYYTIADAAIARGEQLETAAALLRRYLSQPVEGNQPSEAAAHFALGKALAKLDRAAEAVPELRTAIEQDSTLEPAKAALKKLLSGPRP
jgi:tetratricopeptide (TPR) repeat protein